MERAHQMMHPFNMHKNRMKKTRQNFLEDVRLAYIFRIEENGKTYYYSEDGLTEEYSFAEGFYNFFQMPYINENDRMETVEWMRSAIFYQIFVDRFRIGDVNKDAGAPMGYLTQKGFFDTIPKAIDEAAKIDGATNFQIFTKINLPLAKPMIVYTALTSFTWPWSDFILPKLLLKEKNLYTVAVGLMSLDETEFARFAADSVFIALPIVILYFCLVKNMVDGIAAGAVKG